MTPFRAIRLVGEVAKGLDYAHQRNVVHHDVKPANVLLSGTVTLVEKWSGTVRFGAAAMKQRSVVHLSGNDGRGDFPPDREAVSHLGTPFGCGQSVPARPKMR